MDKNDSVIEILDSPSESKGLKRKYGDGGKEPNDYGEGPARKHPLLDSISSRFQQNLAERQKRNAEFETRREMEKVHSNYLKQHVACPQELAKASYAASHWAKKNGLKDTNIRPVQINTPSRSSRRRAKWKLKKANARTCTVTSSSMQSKSGTSSAAEDNISINSSAAEDNISINSSAAEDSISINSLRSKNGELIASHKSTSVSDAKYICPILYCEAEFSSQGALGHHMNLFQHSPCNPLQYVRDTRLMPDPLCYKCPKCDLEYTSKDSCIKHMKDKNHLAFYPPLSITAYLCQQCLYLFKTLESCWDHMEKSRHKAIRFPFVEFYDDDVEFALPVAMSEEFVQDFISKCRKIPFQVQCLDCGMVISSPAELRDHQAETNNFHVMSALTQTSVADVFSSFIKTFSCDTCHRLFDEIPAEDSRHICAGGIVGNIRAGLVRSTGEFVKYSTLSKIPHSLKVGKVDHTKKHDAAEILHFQAVQREQEDTDAEKFGQVRNSIKKINQENSPESRRNKILNKGHRKEQPKESIKNLDLSQDEMKIRLEPVKISVGELSKASIERKEVDSHSHLTEKVVNFNQESKYANESVESVQSSNKQCNDVKKLSDTTFKAVKNNGKERAADYMELIENGRKTIIKEEKFPIKHENVCTVYVNNESLKGEASSSKDSAEAQTDNEGLNTSSTVNASCSYKKEEPSTSSKQTDGGVEDDIAINLIEDTDSDHECMEISDEEESVGQMIISDSSSGDAIIVENQKDKMKKHKKKKKRSRSKKHRDKEKLKIRKAIEHLFLTTGMNDIEDILKNQDKNLISTEHLRKMKNIVFLDLDNFNGFFKCLPQIPTEHTFIWIFYGGKTKICIGMFTETFWQMKKKGLAYVDEPCGVTKDAADFALVFKIGKMDERLPTSVNFTIVSADRGFCEVVRQMQGSARSILLIDPFEEKDSLQTLLKSISET